MIPEDKYADIVRREPVATPQQAAWNALCRFVSKWFYQPDEEALRIALAAGQSSTYLDTDPLWLFIVGPSGCGKTALYIRTLTAFPNHVVMGDLTPSTFLSAKLGKNSFLTSLKRKGNEQPLLLFKDFTTFLSKRADERAIIASQLREIYDGEFNKDTGEAGHQDWKGKLTVLAATTPAVERAWSLMRELGERFISVRVRTGDVREICEYAMQQSGHYKEIADGIKELAGAVIAQAADASSMVMPSAYTGRLTALACMVAQCRRHVFRKDSGNHEILDVSAPEMPSRIMNAMQLVPIANASLAGRTEPGDEDIKLAARIATDSVPATRWKIIDAIPDTGTYTTRDIAEYTGLPDSVVFYHAQELKAVGVLDDNPNYKAGVFSAASDFVKLRRQALPSFGLSPS